MGLTARRPVALGSQKGTTLPCLPERKGRVKTSHKEWACLHFPFPPGRQGREVPLNCLECFKAPNGQANLMVLGAAVFF